MAQSSPIIHPHNINIAQHTLTQKIEQAELQPNSRQSEPVLSISKEK